MSKITFNFSTDLPVTQEVKDAADQYVAMIRAANDDNPEAFKKVGDYDLNDKELHVEVEMLIATIIHRVCKNSMFFGVNKLIVKFIKAINDEEEATKVIQMFQYVYPGRFGDKQLN